MAFEKAAVVGAGTMGNGIAQVFATSGREVTLVDVSESALDRGIENIEKSLGKLVAKERLSAEDRDAALGRLSKATALDGIGDAEISELNIPTGIPLVYELTDDFHPAENKPVAERYLGDAAAAADAAAAVARQAG